jgi:hypothetical protein
VEDAFAALEDGFLAAERAQARGTFAGNNLASGERVSFRTWMHGIFLLPPVLMWFVFVILLAVWFVRFRDRVVLNNLEGRQIALGINAAFGILTALCLLSLIARFATYMYSEFVVTSKRVVVKIGFFKRQSLEFFLRQIESAGVNQGFLGRVLNYGTVVLTGSGGTSTYLPRIARPLAFRKALLEQIENLQR